MLYSVIGNYSLLLGLFFGLVLFYFSARNFKNEINVTYSGAIPNLFEEEKGVVAEGFLKDRNFFSATKILAKHDENYMPPEVKEALGEK